MALVKLQNVKKELADRVLFEIEELSIHSGDRIGLVGTNGSGKTTLLTIISGEIEVEQGYVERNTSVSLLPQLKRTDTTKSGGEVTAEYIIQALNKNPQVLLADEPTTHLDTSHIRWIEQQFQKFQGSLVVISHDREFLDRVCDTIWELNDGKLTVYSGNYSMYKSEKQKEFQQQQIEYEKYVKKSRQLEEAKKRKEKQAQRATKAINSVGDSEYKLKGSTPYFEKKAKKLHKVQKSMETRLEKLEKVDKPKEVNVVKIKLPNMDAIRNRFIIRGFDVEGRVPGKQLFHPSNFTLKGGEKVAVIGDNGSGKTTLLRKILKENDGITLSPAAQIGYFAQNLSVLNKEKTILENVAESSKQSETLIRIVLAQLQFKGREVYKKIKVLSGGERVKVSLAKIIVGDYNTLILDEPTNFLDIQAVQALESLLKQYEGSLILVSHDRRFISEIAEKSWVIEDKKLSEFSGTYEEWERSLKMNTSMNELDEEMVRIENEITTVLGKLSIEPNEELDNQFQELLKRKNQITEKIEKSRGLL